MIPAWKLRRELVRIGQQIKGVGERVTDPIKQRAVDHVVAEGLPCFGGRIAGTNKIAILLVYQPSGVAASTIATCTWLASSGYAPMIVSNAPISAQDRERLTDVVWKAVERPNFGYDFGGYRDGLTCLAQWGVSPDEVLILNDSIWIPLLPDTDLLERLSIHPADIVGTILRTNGNVQFLESYLYRLNQNALKHPRFKEFWAELRLTSNKYHVIRRGERGFGEAMHSAGLKVAQIFDCSELERQIETQDNTFLQKTLKYAAYHDARLAAERDQLIVADGVSFRSAALAHINCVLKKHLAYSTFPYAMVSSQKYPIMKKSYEPISRAWRLAYLAAVEAGDLPQPPDVILSEIRARDRRQG